MRQVLLVAGNAEIEVDLVVVGLEVGVGNRPVFPIAVVRLALEVVVGKAEREAAPDVRFTTQESCAYPGVARARVRMVFLVHQNILDVVRSTPAPDVGEHVLERRPFGVGRLPHRVLVEADCVIAGRRFTAPRVIVRPLHRPQFLLDRDFLPRFKQQHLHPLRCEDMSGHAARRAGAHDDGIVGLREVDILFRGSSEANQSHALSLIDVVGNMHPENRRR